MHPAEASLSLIPFLAGKGSVPRWMLQALIVVVETVMLGLGLAPL
jgi:hypothetical protein